MISSRLPKSLELNAVSRALDAKRRSGTPIVDLTETNPTGAGFTYPRELLEPLAHPRGLAYDPQALGLWTARVAVAADFRRRGSAISADRVALTSSTSEAYALLFKLLCDAGDAVLVPRPSYPLFEHLTELECVRAIPYALEYHGSWRIDVESIKRAPADRVRAILIVSPNNPTGSFLPRDDLRSFRGLPQPMDGRSSSTSVRPTIRSIPAPAATHVLASGGVLTFSLGGLSKSEACRS